MLAAQEHLQLALGHDRFNAPQPVPGIFVQITHANVKGRAAPNLDGVKAAVVDGRAQRQQIVGGDPGGELALLAIARR